MIDRVTVTGANKLFFVFSVLFLIFQVVLTVMTGLYGQDFIYDNIYVIFLINEFILILIPVLLYSFAKKLDIKKVFRFNKLDFVPGVLIFLMSVPAYFASLMLNNIVAFLLQFIGDIPAQQLPVPENLTELMIGVFIVAVSPAICEEMLNRGILLNAYERRGSIKAVIITSVFFGIIHFDVSNLLGPVFMGLLIGYYVIRTNSILAGMFAHFLNNLITEIILFIWKDEHTSRKIIISAGELGSIVLIGIVSLILVWVLIRLFSYMTAGKQRMIPPLSAFKNDIISIISHWPVIAVLTIYILFLGLYMFTIIFIRVNGLS